MSTEQRVWLIWGLNRKHETCDLIAIATTEEIRDRYTKGQQFDAIHTEHVLLDHAYGHGMILEAMNRAKRRAALSPLRR